MHLNSSLMIRNLQAWCPWMTWHRLTKYFRNNYSAKRWYKLWLGHLTFLRATSQNGSCLQLAATNWRSTVSVFLQCQRQLDATQILKTLSRTVAKAQHRNRKKSQTCAKTLNWTSIKMGIWMQEAKFFAPIPWEAYLVFLIKPMQNCSTSKNVDYDQC